MEASLGGLGHALLHLTCAVSTCTWIQKGSTLAVGLLALAYACSDLGLIQIPRPTVMPAAPITWWRWWKPYGAALAYGAALGFGFTTRIWFGAFYVLCAWCLFQGNPGFGALLMGTYGFARALILFPASWCVYRRGTDHRARLEWILTKGAFAQQFVAMVLLLLGVELIGLAVF